MHFLSYDRHSYMGGLSALDLLLYYMVTCAVTINPTAATNAGIMCIKLAKFRFQGEKPPVQFLSFFLKETYFLVCPAIQLIA